MTEPKHEIRPGDVVVTRHNYRRTPGVAYTTWRYGVAHHDPDDGGWFGGWPAYASRALAEESVRWYRDGGVPGAFVVVYPPEPAPFAWRMEIA